MFWTLNFAADYNGPLRKLLLGYCATTRTQCVLTRFSLMFGIFDEVHSFLEQCCAHDLHFMKTRYFT